MQIWHGNMPYDKIVDRKGHQGWMKKEGPYFIFPGGGTMFPDGAIKYIEKLGKYIPFNKGIVRTALDMGCGVLYITHSMFAYYVFSVVVCFISPIHFLVQVASFGGFLLEKNIMTLSFAPRDSHKAQIQFALERGIPAFVAMLGTRRLPFPAFSFDMVHCSRCLIPFTAYSKYSHAVSTHISLLSC